jgi:hypothetical protein
MRGAVFYDHGHRPSFRQADGSFFDGDEVDLKAYHIIARSHGRAVGCSRVMPLGDSGMSTIENAVGEQQFQNILRDLGTTRERTYEASRWTVVPECRGELGPRMVAASWVVARWLDAEVALVLAGTRQKQDLALVRMGAHPVRGLPLLVSEVFDDELRILYFDVPHPPQAMLRSMAEVSHLLRPVETRTCPCWLSFAAHFSRTVTGPPGELRLGHAELFHPPEPNGGWDVFGAQPGSTERN